MFYVKITKNKKQKTKQIANWQIMQMKKITNFHLPLCLLIGQAGAWRVLVWDNYGKQHSSYLLGTSQ